MVCRSQIGDQLMAQTPNTNNLATVQWELVHKKNNICIFMFFIKQPKSFFLRRRISKTKFLIDLLREPVRVVHKSCMTLFATPVFVLANHLKLAYDIFIKEKD